MNEIKRKLDSKYRISIGKGLAMLIEAKVGDNIKITKANKKQLLVEKDNKKGS